MAAMKNIANKKQIILKTVEEFSAFAPRIGENERKTSEIIQKKLKDKNIGFFLQNYFVDYPVFQKYELFVDGDKIPCLPSGLKSGKIQEKTIIDSVHISGRDFQKANINFNPYCPAISKPTFYRSPSLAVSRKDLNKILNAEKIKGNLAVKWKRFKENNILTGNINNPYRIIFSHYDSWWGGCIDNGFSVAILLELAATVDLRKNLIVFGGSEEISRDFPYYWCYGYKEFEKKYSVLMKKAKEILVIDAIGYGVPELTSDKSYVKEAFCVKNQEFVKKTKLFAGDYFKLMEIYHSEEDNMSKITHFDVCFKSVNDLLR